MLGCAFWLLAELRLPLRDHLSSRSQIVIDRGGGAVVFCMFPTSCFAVLTAISFPIGYKVTTASDNCPVFLIIRWEKKLHLFLERANHPFEHPHNKQIDSSDKRTVKKPYSPRREEPTSQQEAPAIILLCLGLTNAITSEFINSSFVFRSGSRSHVWYHSLFEEVNSLLVLNSTKRHDASTSGI